MYQIFATTQFKKDLKKFKNERKNLEAIENCIYLLQKGGIKEIPSTMKPHKLIGNYAGMYECHIFSDLLIIWIQIDEPSKEIRLARLGSHSDLF